MTWGRRARASLNKRFLQLHKPTVKKVQSLVRSCWPSLRLQSWAQLVREADSLLAELIIHFKVKCWLIMHPICSQERNMLQILLHLKTWLRANSSLAFRFASLVLEAERVERGNLQKKMEGYYTYAFTMWLYLQSALWSPAECEEIGHRGRVTSWKHVISIWPLLIEDVSAVEWVMTQEPSCSATDGLQTPTTHTNTHNTRLSPFISYSFQLSSSLFF